MRNSESLIGVFHFSWIAALTMACWSCGGKISGPCLSQEEFPPRFQTGEEFGFVSPQPFASFLGESDFKELEEWLFSIWEAGDFERVLHGEALPEIPLVAGVRGEVNSRLNSNDRMWEYSLMGIAEPLFSIGLFSVLTGPAHDRLEQSVDYALAVGEDCNWFELSFVADRLLRMAEQDERVMSILRDRMPNDWVSNTVWRDIVGWNQEWEMLNWHSENGEELSRAEICGILEGWARRMSKSEERGGGNLEIVEALLDWKQSGEAPALLIGISIPVDESNPLVRLIRAINREE